MIEITDEMVKKAVNVVLGQLGESIETTPKEIVEVMMQTQRKALEAALC